MKAITVRCSVGWVERSATHRFFMPPIIDQGMTMTNYRRSRLPGATYFFTVAIAERHLDLLVRYIEDLKAAFRDEQQRAPFVNIALVVLPDHLHAIWRLP